MKSTVYMITNAVNGKRYIGITSRYLCWRKYQHYRAAFKLNAPSAIARALRKYGKEALEFEVVKKVDTYAEAQAEEMRLIAELKPEYNMTAGGGGSVGFTHSEETKAKLRKINKGKPGPWRGKGVPPGFAKPRTDEWRAKIGAGNKGKVRSLETVAAMHKRTANGNVKYKGIVCINDGKTFVSAAEAARFYGADAKTIGFICKRQKYYSTRGLVFRFVGEPHGGPEEAKRCIEEARASQRRGLDPIHRKSFNGLAAPPQIQSD